MNAHSETLLRFTASGFPAPQGSKRHVGGGRMIESSKELPAWRKAVKAAASRAQSAGWTAIDHAVTVRLVLHLPKPPGTKFKDLPAGPPDLDKLQRAIGDALEQSGTLTNDSRITGWISHKYWATETNPPGARIDILTTTNPDEHPTTGVTSHDDSQACEGVLRSNLAQARPPGGGRR